MLHGLFLTMSDTQDMCQVFREEENFDRKIHFLENNVDYCEKLLPEMSMTARLIVYVIFPVFPFHFIDFSFVSYAFHFALSFSYSAVPYTTFAVSLYFVVFQFRVWVIIVGIQIGSNFYSVLD